MLFKNTGKHNIVKVGVENVLDYRMAKIAARRNKNEWTLSELEIETGLSKEKLQFELEKLKVVIEGSQKEQIQLYDDRVIFPALIQTKWLDLLFEKKETDVIYSESERQKMIFLLIYSEGEAYSVFHFQELLKVSKNTILSDLKKIRKQIEKEPFVLLYSRKKGFYLNGDEEKIRSAAYLTVGKLLLLENGSRLLYRGLWMQNPAQYVEVRESFAAIKNENNLVIVPSRMEEMYYFISYTLQRAKKYTPKMTNKEKAFLRKLDIRQSSSEFIAHFKEVADIEIETDYFTIIFMTVLQGKIEDTELEFLLECASKIIHEVERLSAVVFRNYRKLLFDLFYHLVPAYFRLQYGLSLNNVMIDEIKNQYEEIYTLTTIALTPLQELVKEPISEAEIGYFTILFGGEIMSQKQENRFKQPTALIVCPSGISSSLMMKSELEKIFPLIHFKEAGSLTQLDKTELNDYDVIFSTVSIPSEKKVYVIHPIMNHLEKMNLIREVQQELLLPGILVPSVQEVVDLILPHVELKKDWNKEKLYQTVYQKIEKRLKKGDDRPVLLELLTPDMIQLSDEEMDWKDAIRLAAEPLRKDGKIEDRYIDAMIDKVNTYGPFIHIGKGLALPHARPEDGVKRLGMSMLKVKKPVLLLNDESHPVQIFICLAAVDNEMHLRALSSLTKILSNKESLDELLQAHSKEEILNVLRKGENEQ